MPKRCITPCDLYTPRLRSFQISINYVSDATPAGSVATVLEREPGIEEHPESGNCLLHLGSSVQDQARPVSEAHDVKIQPEDALQRVAPGIQVAPNAGRIAAPDGISDNQKCLI